MTGMETLMYRVASAAAPRLTTKDRVAIAIKLFLSSNLCTILAPIAFPWGGYSTAKMYGYNTYLGALIGSFAIVTAPLCLLVSPLFLALPWMPGFEIAAATVRAQAKSRDPMVWLIKWSYR